MYQNINRCIYIDIFCALWNIFYFQQLLHRDFRCGMKSIHLGKLWIKKATVAETTWLITQTESEDKSWFNSLPSNLNIPLWTRLKNEVFGRFQNDGRFLKLDMYVLIKLKISHTSILQSSSVMDTKWKKSKMNLPKTQPCS